MRGLVGDRPRLCIGYLPGRRSLLKFASPMKEIRANAELGSGTGTKVEITFWNPLSYQLTAALMQPLALLYLTA